MLRRNVKTLDTQHSSRVSEFKNQNDYKEEKLEELEQIKETLEKHVQAGLSNLSEKDFEKYMSLYDKKLDIEKELSKVVKCVEEVDYYINTADIIFKYYDIVENSNNVHENETPITENSILNFFTMRAPNMDEDKPREIENDRASLLDKYMQIIDNDYIPTVEYECSEECPICSSKNRTLLVNDGLMYCNDCYTIETIIIDHEKPSYKDPPKEININWSQKCKLVVKLTATFLNCGKILRYLSYLLKLNCVDLDNPQGSPYGNLQRLNRKGVISLKI
jgi:hypothetical protein